jgi:hypothetical protein
LTNDDLKALISSATHDDSYGGPGILIPSRNTQHFRWCLNNGLRLVQQLTLMTIGLYNEPAGPICLRFCIENHGTLRLQNQRLTL